MGEPSLMLRVWARRLSHEDACRYADPGYWTDPLEQSFVKCKDEARCLKGSPSNVSRCSTVYFQLQPIGFMIPQFMF